MQKAAKRTGGKSTFRYRDRDRTTEDVSRRAKQSSGSFDKIIKNNVAEFRPKEGEHQIRILPRTWDDTDKWEASWEIKVFVHYSVGADSGTYLCLDKNFGKECPICEMRNQSDDEDERNDLRPRARALCYVIDRNAERAGPQIWSMPLSLAADIHNRVLKISEKRGGELLAIDDPDEGYDITFEREGTDLHTKYTSLDIERDSSKLSTKAARQEEWLAYIEEHPLPEMLNEFDAEYLEKIVNGQRSSKRGDEEDEEDEGDNEARGSRRASRDTGSKARRGRDEEEAEDDDDDGDDAKSTDRSSGRRRLARDADDEEADEDVKPVRSKKRRDEEEEDEEPEEDEEDEKPSRSARGSRHTRDEEEDEEPEEDENETEDDEDEPPARGKGKRAKAAKDEDEEPEEESEEDEEEEVSKNVKSKLSKLKARASK